MTINRKADSRHGMIRIRVASGAYKTLWKGRQRGTETQALRDAYTFANKRWGGGILPNMEKAGLLQIGVELNGEFLIHGMHGENPTQTSEGRSLRRYGK